MKPITKVFLVIAALVLALVVWGLFFNQGGMLETAYNAVISPVNKMWKNISGSEENLLPEWKIQSSDGVVDDNTDQTGGF